MTSQTQVVAVPDREPREPLRLVLADSLIVANRQALKIRVVEAIAAGQSTVVLDLSECGYIDSSGLGVLVSLAKKCQAAGGSLVLENVNEELCTLLELSRMDTVLTVARKEAP